MLSLQPGPKTTAFPLLLLSGAEKLGLGDSVDLHVYEIPVGIRQSRGSSCPVEKHSPQVSGAQVSGERQALPYQDLQVVGPGWMVCVALFLL